MKIRYLVGILVMAVLMSGCVNQPDVVDNSTKTSATVVTNVVSNATADKQFDEYLAKYKQKRVFSGNSSMPDREAYGISTRVFELLPPVPTDFLYKVYLIKYGRFVDVSKLGPEYYLQPEFDPDFTRFGLKYWEEWQNSNYSKTHWGTLGFRSYPYSQHIVAKPGYSFNVTLFFSANWNVETYQGILLTPIFLNSAISEDGKSLKATPGGEKYINVNITPNEFLLTPPFPQFTENWAKKLTITGKIADNTPPGTYIISMTVDKPSQVNSDKWLLQYLNLYSEGPGMLNADKPYLQAFVYVQ